MITLHSLSPSQDRHQTKRVGRGNSSGKGTTAGRGTKGQRARTGGRNKTTRRALKALIERTPKLRGFRSRRPVIYAVTVKQLSTRAKEGQLITAAVLAGMNMIPRTRGGLKIIGTADLKKTLTVKANAFSKSAAAAITKDGGYDVVITK